MPDTKPPFRFWRFFFSPNGRVSRLAIWAFALPVRLASLATVLAMQAIGFPVYEVDTLSSTPWFMLSMVNALIVFVTMWPMYAILTKRLHDIGWTGLPALIVFAPLVSGIFTYLSLKLSQDIALARAALSFIPVVLNNLPSVLVLVLACIPGQNGTNRFGAPLIGSSNNAAHHF